MLAAGADSELLKSNAVNVGELKQYLADHHVEVNNPSRLRKPEWVFFG
jgi:hypothetical protein